MFSEAMVVKLTAQQERTLPKKHKGTDMNGQNYVTYFQDSQTSMEFSLLVASAILYIKEMPTEKH
jgi:hypothetical protein